jgi:4-hydroxy-tetrahydrodipicolinate synthase
VVTPYYSKPPQEGIFRHFKAVAASVDIPVIICNAPDRTAMDLSSHTLERLRDVAGIVGLVDCTGDIARLLPARDGRRARFRHFSGHDLTAFAYMLSGGTGTLSVAANVAPRLVVAMHVAIATGNIDAAATLHLRLRPLMEALQREPTPAVAKQALQFVVGIDPEVRLPLTPVEPETAAALRLALSALPHQGIRRLAV